MEPSLTGRVIVALGSIVGTPKYKAAATRKKPMMMANTAHSVLSPSYVVLIIDGRESTRLSQFGHKGSSLDG